jgi:hypothetical protein
VEAPEPNPNESTTDQSEPEGLLYHYTTQEGLLGIIEKQKIWASHLQYLNDKSEGQIFTKLLLDEFARRVANGPEEPPSQLTAYAQLLMLSVGYPESEIQCAHKEVLHHGSIAFSWISDQDAFVTSFSEQGDLLSQWRAYSGATGGYSIGFRRPYLNSIGVRFIESRKESFYDDSDPLVACRYCNKTAEDCLRREIEQIVDLYINEAKQLERRTVSRTQEEFKALFATAKRHFFPLGKRRAITKDPAFHEEAEWRLVFQLEGTGTANSEPEFRLGRSMPIPYFQVDLTWEDQALEIPEVIVGPCPHPFEAKKSVERLLRKAGVRKLKVINSAIPFRNW